MEKHINIFLIVISYIFWGSTAMASSLSSENTTHISRTESPVKLLFIHHSVGGYWLAHDNGGLVNELNKNNYYVNDVTYGWEPPVINDIFVNKVKRKVLSKLGMANKGVYGIGDRTDIGQMPDWFLGPDSGLIMKSLYAENRVTDNFGVHKNSTSSNPLSNPDILAENQIIIFKSCFPNTLLRGNANDPASQLKSPVRGFIAGSEEHTVANAKRVFNDLLAYFESRPDKFFIIVTPPPCAELPENGLIARGFCNWLVHDWLKENNYSLNNIIVFDLFNVLTSGKGPKQNDANEELGNHHRIWKGQVQHIVQHNNNLLFYQKVSGDDHPTAAGLQKATREFVPLLNYYYSEWKAKQEK